MQAQRNRLSLLMLEQARWPFSIISYKQCGRLLFRTGLANLKNLLIYKRTCRKDSKFSETDTSLHVASLSSPRANYIPYQHTRIKGEQEWKNHLPFAWRIVFQLQSTDRQLRAWVRQGRAHHETTALQFMFDAEQEKDRRAVWHATHKLCRTKKANKNRWGRAGKQSNPNMKEVCQRMKHTPASGGMIAVDAIEYEDAQGSNEASQG